MIKRIINKKLRGFSKRVARQVNPVIEKQSEHISFLRDAQKESSDILSMLVDQLNQIDERLCSLQTRFDGDNSSQSAAIETYNLQKIEEATWKSSPVRDVRINEKISALVSSTISDRSSTDSRIVLEIGGREHPRKDFFESLGFRYINLDLSDVDARVPTLVGDITDCDHIESEQFDMIVSHDVFEHIREPWKAAGNIVRLLKPGGVAYTSTLFAWRYHPCPVDFWRYTPEALRFLFRDLNCLYSEFDMTERRRDIRFRSPNDLIEPDSFGGFRENIRVHYAGRKTIA